MIPKLGNLIISGGFFTREEAIYKGNEIKSPPMYEQAC